MPVIPGDLIVELSGAVIQTLAVDVPVLSIGRLPDNALPLPHPLVSRHHATLHVEAERLVLTDLGSSNGTFVEGTRLLANQPRVLAAGESFQIGPFLVTYRVPEAELPVDGGMAPEDVTEAPALAPEPEQQVLAVVAEPPAALAPPRRTHPAPRPLGPLSSYLDHLPVIFQESDFLGRFLLIFESIWEPLEQRQDHLHMYVDPNTCPVSFLPWLSSWLDLAHNPHWSEARTRRLLAEAMDLYRWRGTRYGMARIIELCTGLTPEISEVAAQPFVFRLRLRLPADGSVTPELVEGLVQAHKPAHAGYILDLKR